MSSSVSLCVVVVAVCRVSRLVSPHLYLAVGVNRVLMVFTTFSNHNHSAVFGYLCRAPLKLNPSVCVCVLVECVM